MLGWISLEDVLDLYIVDEDELYFLCSKGKIRVRGQCNDGSNFRIYLLRDDINAQGFDFNSNPSDEMCSHPSRHSSRWKRLVGHFVDWTMGGAVSLSLDRGLSYAYNKYLNNEKNSNTIYQTRINESIGCKILTPTRLDQFAIVIGAENIIFSSKNRNYFEKFAGLDRSVFESIIKYTPVDLDLAIAFVSAVRLANRSFLKVMTVAEFHELAMPDNEKDRQSWLLSLIETPMGDNWFRSVCRRNPRAMSLLRGRA